MELTDKRRTAERSTNMRFRIGSPDDSDDLLRLFSLVLGRADNEASNGRRFEIPFAALLRLGNHNRPTLEDLNRFSQSGRSGKDWPVVLQNAEFKRGGPGMKKNGIDSSVIPGESNNDTYRREMFKDILQFAVASAERCNITDGPQVCRVLAAVGQTLQAQERQFREWNRRLAEGYQEVPQRRVTTPLKRDGDEPEIVVRKSPPWQVDFSCKQEEGACLRYNGLVLWHASYVGPRSAEKSENQDATFAMTSPEVPSPPYLVFALADGVTTSMGSRFAARSIVRRFCEDVLEDIKKDQRVTSKDLIAAARKTQASLDELTKTLLRKTDSYVFDAVRGFDLQRSAAVKVLENTLNPRVEAIPAALTATLIGGIVQFNRDTGIQQIELLRIGDGSVEHVDSVGKVTSILDTDPDELAISEGIGPGPRSRAIFEQPDQLVAKTVMLGPRESLIVSSDGLARGHKQTVTSKVAELLGEEFWQTARVEEADAALRMLHKACSAADEIFRSDAKQSLFADNVSLIVIRSGG